MQTTQYNPQPKVENPYIAKPEENNNTQELVELLETLIEECHHNRSIKTAHHYDEIIARAQAYITKLND